MIIASNVAHFRLQRSTAEIDGASYRPQRSWRKVIFSQASVILSRGVPAPEGLLPGGGVCSWGISSPTHKREVEGDLV